MGKIILFLAVVLLGSIGLTILSNMDFSKPKTEPIGSKNNVSPAPNNKNATPSASILPGISQTSEPEKINTATIKTSKGDIVLSLYEKDAPKTVENFVKKAKSGFYNNLTFHRVEDWVIQGGDPEGNGTGGGNMPTELNDKPFVIGSLGVARGQDIKISNDSQFFITKKDASWLNKQYTNFGMVTSGMDVAEKIQIGDKIIGITIE
ncbi:MAG: peptidylprolyl isomerase [Candidatus Levybacteria bacterium]|nr:peptidylprolyl isomerase [Candidatus Levybacteria bacterium]